MDTSYGTNTLFPNSTDQSSEIDPVTLNLGRTAGLIFGCAMIGTFIGCIQMPNTQDTKTRFTDSENLHFVFYASVIGGAIGLVSGIAMGLIECYSKRNRRENNG